jgi:hypothetical protein
MATSSYVTTALGRREGWVLKEIPRQALVSTWPGEVSS